MDKIKTIQTLFLCLIILFPGNTFSNVEDEERNHAENPQEKSYVTKMMRDMHSLIPRFSLCSWDKFKSFIHEVQLQFFPPNLDFRSTDEASTGGGNGDHGGAGERMKDAVEKSFGTSKVVVEESAKSAAKAVGEAVHKTAEKVKDSMSRRDESDAEL